jgi:hypothetical protein
MPEVCDRHRRRIQIQDNAIKRQQPKERLTSLEHLAHQRKVGMLEYSYAYE